jgi:hypothetical protein
MVMTRTSLETTNHARKKWWPCDGPIGGSLECHNVIANGGYGRPCNGPPTTTTIKLMLVFLWRVWHLSNMKHLFTPRLNADLCFLFALHKLMDVPFRRFVSHSEKLSGRNYVYLYTPPLEKHFILLRCNLYVNIKDLYI